MMVANGGDGFDWFEVPFEAPALDAMEGFDNQLWDPFFEPAA
jgi:hypothetical protein